MELCHYEGGFYGPSWWYQWITLARWGYDYTVTASPGELDSLPVDFDFCDANFDSLPTNYVIGFEDTLYIRISVPLPESVNPYAHCALMCEQAQTDTFYYDIPVDSLNESVAKGKVFPAKTLGGDTQVLHGFSTIHGYTFKGDSIYGEDWVDVGQLYIIVRGTTPGTISNSFLSTNQLEFEAVTRSHSGNTVTPSNNSIIWGTIALNDTSGFLSPDSGRGRIFHSIPNPKNAPYTRGEALAYKCSCSVNYSGVGAQDWVILRQDERDQLIQEYIDSQKSRTPLRQQFRFSMGSYVFPDHELRSSDYSCFMFSQELLDALVATRFSYGHVLHVHEFDDAYRAYLSPNMLFTTKPVGGGQPSYWEEHRESPHLYGNATDIEVEDIDLDGLFKDDWDTLAAVMRTQGIEPVNMGDSTYIHAELGATQTSMVSVDMTPDTVEPGWGLSRYYRQQEQGEPSAVRTCLCTQGRQFSISGRIDTSLAQNGQFDGHVTLRVDEVPFSGGWGLTGRPMIHDPVPSVISSSELTHNLGEFRDITYRDTCEWGGEIQLHAYYSDGVFSYDGADTVSLTLGFVVDLERAYQPAPSIFLYTGAVSPAFHRNHYIDGDYRVTYRQIVNDFRTRVLEAGLDIPVVYGNDISLQDGGRFDCQPPWWRGKSHIFHRWGCDADMQYAGWEYNSQIWDIMRDVISRNSGHAPQRERRCFHIYFDCRAGCNAE